MWAGETPGMETGRGREDHLPESGESGLTRGGGRERRNRPAAAQVRPQEQLGLRPPGGAEDEACGAALFGREAPVRPDDQERLPGGGGRILLVEKVRRGSSNGCSEET